MIELNPLLYTETPYYVQIGQENPLLYQEPLTILYKETLTMDGKPSLTIEGNPLLIKKTFKNTPYYRKKPLTTFQKQIP